MTDTQSTQSVSLCGIQSLKKVELHAHLFGCFDIQRLACVCVCAKPVCVCGNPVCVCVKPVCVCGKLVCVCGKLVCACEYLDADKSLPECFEYFECVYRYVTNPEILETLILHTLITFAEDGVVYLEIRTSLKSFEEFSFTEFDYVRLLIKCINTVEQTHPIHVRVLLSLNRGKLKSHTHTAVCEFEKLICVADMFPERVVGIDISGDPTVGDFTDIKRAIETYRQRVAEETKLKFTIHTAETTNYAETDMILDTKPNRLGHCCYLTDAQEARIVKECIPIELCPTSNEHTMKLEHFGDHHFSKFWKQTLVAVCTDDTGLFRTTLSQELKKVADHFKLGLEDIAALQDAAAEMSFLDTHTKQHIRNLLKQNTQQK